LVGLTKPHTVVEVLLAMNAYDVLEIPLVYRTAQAVLAPGAQRRGTKLLGRLLHEVSPGERVLDVACGRRSWLDWAGIVAVGSDISESYMREYARAGRHAVVNSADALPFGARSFDSVWSLALLHHLCDDAARAAIREMVRVCRPGGYVVVVDAVMPKRAWARPLAYAIRRIDRGRFVRDEAAHQALLDATLPRWRSTRVNATDNGLEAVWAWSQVAATSSAP
jgi:SAM-dependent methyltransferase